MICYVWLLRYVCMFYVIYVCYATCARFVFMLWLYARMYVKSRFMYLCFVCMYVLYVCYMRTRAMYLCTLCMLSVFGMNACAYCRYVCNTVLYVCMYVGRLCVYTGYARCVCMNVWCVMWVCMYGLYINMFSVCTV